MMRQFARAAARCLVVTTTLSFGVPPTMTWAQDSTNISAAAYALINNRAVADQGSFYVYLDEDAGQNHGFPSGFMGTDQSTITLNTGCVDSSTSSTGCSADPTVVDGVHGTVLSISIAAQPSGNWAGLALEEPQEWLGLQYGNGYNLTGATSISFNVRSPNGAQVQFGVGGCVTPFTSPISSTWTTMTLSLNTSSLSCNPALSDVHLLFEVVTNDVHDPHGAIVLLDNIQFSPVPAAQTADLSFPLANQTFGVVPQLAPPIPSDQVLRNTTTIYESALAEYLLLARGTAQDLQNAKLIANAFDYALHHESHGDPIPGAKGGYTGLHNGYENGAVALYNNQPLPLLGQAGDVRLAGFTDTSLCSPSGYCLVLDGATGGNNAFAIVALVDAYRQFGNVNYLNDALTIGNWIIGNLTDTTGTGYGGYYVGYGDEGIPPPKPVETGKSVENNADIFAAFTALANVELQLGNTNAAAGWTSAANAAGDFVMEMYDGVHGRFNVGTSPLGTSASPGTCPTGAVKGKDVINVCDFLDSNTFTTLAMAGAPRYQNQINWRLPIQYVLSTFAQTVTAAGHSYSGFNVVPTPDSGANGIAWEFTGQTVVAMNYVDRLYNMTTFQSQANFYLGQIAQAQSLAPFGDGLGLVAATLQSGDLLTPVNQCLSTPYQCIAERVGLAATSWAILAEMGLNYYSFLPASAVPIPTTTTLTTSSLPSSAGQLITLTAEVLGPNNGIPTGSVSFYNGNSLLGTAPMSSVWAYLATSALAVGTDSVTAIYNGDVNYAASTSNVISQVVTAAPLGPQGYTYNVLYSFLTNSPDGAGPIGNIVRDSSGNLYGATEFGGNSGGTVYKLTTAGKESLLYEFAPGSLPDSGLITDSLGNLFGTTEFSANSGPGSVYRVTTGGVGTLLYSFTGGTDGGYPEAGLVEDSAGNLYGTTLSGGANGWGGVFKLTPAGKESVPHSFTGQEQPPDGGTSVADLIQDAQGNLYGTTIAGGTYGWGTVFELTPAGVETLLHDFSNGADGKQPNAGVVRDVQGNLYGTAAFGGDSQCLVVSWMAGCGTVYKLSPTGQLTVLHTFTGGQDGAMPVSHLLMDSQGNLYGTTAYGAHGYGTVFKISPSGVETVLYSFAGSPDGTLPVGGLVADPQGNLYGTTYRGGSFGAGTVFKLTPPSLPALTSIAVTPANPSIAKGLTQAFIAVGTYSDGSTQTLTNSATWTSGTPAASITAAGVATGLATGTSTIGAKVGAITGSTLLTVTAPALTSLVVTPANPSIAKGLTQAFVAVGTYSDGSTQTLTNSATWTSGTPATASITAAGVATGLAAGTSTISAKLGAITGSTVLMVTVPTLTQTTFVTTSLQSSIGYGHLTALSTTTGGSLWDYQYQGPFAGPFFGLDQTAYVLSKTNGGGFITAVNPNTGAAKWSTQITTGNLVMYGPVFGGDGTLFIVGDSTAAVLSAINPTNGSTIWSYQSSGLFTAPVLGPDGTVYVAGSGGLRMMAFNPQTGALKWTYSVPVGTISDPKFGSDGTVFFTSFADGSNGTATLTAINPQNGSKKWSYAAGDTLFTTPVLGRDGTVYVLYTAGSSGYLTALNPASGAVKWTYAAFRNDLSKFTLNRPVFGADGTVFLTAWSNTTADLTALAPQNGTVKWNYAVGNTTKISAPSVAANGTVYLTSHTNGVDAVMAFNPVNGVRQWQDAYTSIISATTIGSDGTVYVTASSAASNTGTAYLSALNPQTGTTKWSSVVASGYFTVNNPIFGPDGSVYVSVLAGTASCFSFNPQTGKSNWQFVTGPAVAVGVPAFDQ